MNQANTDLTPNNITTLCALVALSTTLVTSPSIAAGYDIWIYPLQLDKQTASWQLGAPKSVSNRQGYDNQPTFSAKRWQDHTIFEVNKEAPHASFFPYSSVSKATKDEYRNSGNFLDLNGIWQFHYAKNPTSGLDHK
ncbi:exported protein of unknown function, might belong to Beta-galactosidase [Shewanella benthica]|uniref:Beta-galactosidase n=1 Tax=Shewanella benthica TaxID=43661 RepID=A0A330M766_9GAMM|nr:hypothetical protein [Shewanella benthica]SQH78356.1 exported protein of unknown function, might belong to Beta-galactosidase [Shewanella benthica]